MQIEFFKYQGAGNDFIILDDRFRNIDLSEQQIERLCNRRFGIGADGLMLLKEKEGYDFEMVYYNADGREGSMCGNGGRCIVRFVSEQGLRKQHYYFIATDGEHEATIEDNGWINLKMKDVNHVENKYGHFILDTGSPHYIKPVDDLSKTDVVEEGKEIRYSKAYAKEGINVNFVQTDTDKIFVRTYERGVENETLSCGTGVTASALVFAHNEAGFNHVDVKTSGGNLAVEFVRNGDNSFSNIWLCGPAAFVFKGSIVVE